MLIHQLFTLSWLSIVVEVSIEFLFCNFLHLFFQLFHWYLRAVKLCYLGSIVFILFLTELLLLRNFDSKKFLFVLTFSSFESFVETELVSISGSMDANCDIHVGYKQFTWKGNNELSRLTFFIFIVIDNPEKFFRWSFLSFFSIFL